MILTKVVSCTCPAGTSGAAGSAWDGANGTSSRRTSGAGTSSAATSPRRSDAGGSAPWEQQQAYAVPAPRVRDWRGLGSSQARKFVWLHVKAFVMQPCGDLLVHADVQGTSLHVTCRGGIPSVYRIYCSLAYNMTCIACFLLCSRLLWSSKWQQQQGITVTNMAASPFPRRWSRQSLTASSRSTSTRCAPSAPMICVLLFLSQSACCCAVSGPCIVLIDRHY